MITLFRRGRVFWAESNFSGQRERWSLKTRDRQVAERLKRAHELQILGHGRLAPKRWVEFQDEFLSASKPQIRKNTYDEYERVLVRFSRFLESAKVSDVLDIVPGLITRYTESRRKDIHRVNRRPMSDGGIKYELRVLHRVFNFAVESDYLEKNPVLARNLNSTAGRTQPFSPDEVKVMLTSKYIFERPYLRAIVLLFLHTGLRISDVIYLKKSAIAKGVLTVKTQKRDTVVRLELHEEVVDALNAIKSSQDSPYVFPTETGQPIVSLAKHLGRLFKRCGIVGGHAHRFRDTFSVALLAQGASLYEVAQLLGIGYLTVERHYAPYVKELQERGGRLISQLNFHADSTHKSP